MMKATPSIVAFTIVAAFLAGAAWGQTTPSPILKFMENQLALLLSKNPAKYAETFAENGIVLPQGRPMVKGRAAIQRLGEQELQEDGPINAESPIIDSGTSGDLGYAVYTGSTTNKGGTKTSFHGVTVLRRVNGEWKAIVDAYSFDQPPAQK
jgi:ketosteroid isomerase-like protein